MSKHVSATPALQGWDGVDRSLAEIREIEAKIKTLEADRDRIKAELDLKYSTDAQPLFERIALLEKGIEEFASFHRADLAEDKDAKSRMLNHGRIGFRLGNWSLKLVSKKTWDMVLEKLREQKMKKFIRVKEEVNKDALLQSDLDEQALKALGVRKERTEKFFYETKAEAAVATPNAAG